MFTAGFYARGDAQATPFLTQPLARNHFCLITGTLAIMSMPGGSLQGIDGGRVAANESLKAEISKNGLRKTTKETGLDRKTIRAILKVRRVETSTLTKVVIGLRKE